MTRHKRILIAGAALVLGGNAFALIGVAYNRSGAPDAQVELSERELVSPPRYAIHERENSGLALQIAWRLDYGPQHTYSGHVRHRSGAPWLDRDKLKSLGFKLAAAPELETVITTPVFGKDGNLIDTPGYHESDRLWLQLPGEFTLPGIARAPTPEQIAQAKSIFLDDLFVDFPFVTEGDRAGIFAALLLPFMRGMIQGPAPIHLVEAPKAGSGKGLLCNLVSIVATGAACDAQTLPTQEEEVRKKLTAELSKARSIILLDNAEERKRVDSSSLASVATSETWTDRVLGQSKMITMKNRALWFLTGNNPVLSNEITRRCIRIRLDAKLDMPWKRDGFKHKDIVGWAKQNRPKLVHAALTLIQAWIAAGRPSGSKSLGSFEHWAAVLDGVLQVIGIEGFLDNLDEFYAQADTESEVWREFTAVWWSLFAGVPKKVTELNALCEKHDLLQLIRGDGTERSQQLRLGKALKNSRDRVYGDLQIQMADDAHSKTKMYFLRQLSTDAEERFNHNMSTDEPEVQT